MFQTTNQSSTDVNMIYSASDRLIDEDGLCFVCFNAAFGAAMRL